MSDDKNVVNEIFSKQRETSTKENPAPSAFRTQEKKIEDKENK